MTKIKISTSIYDLREEIRQIQSEFNELGDPPVDIPEMIDFSNLLRSNEYLLKSDQKKTHLISKYSEYSASLEILLSSVFEIQTQLKEILQEQSLMIESKSKSKSKPKSKPKSKK